MAAKADGAVRRHLIILGDVIDFDRIRHAGSTGDLAAHSAAIDLLGVTHAPFVESLRVAGRAGFNVHVVAGNHDPEWVLPDVAHRLRRLLGDDASVEIHPWILRVCGRLHAEHGNHFHDLNAMPRPSQPFAHDAPGLHLGSVIDRWSGDVARVRATMPRGNARGRAVGTVRLFGIHMRLAWQGVGRLIAMSAPAERQRRLRYRSGDLARYEQDIGLRADAAAVLDRSHGTRASRLRPAARRSTRLV